MLHTKTDLWKLAMDLVVEVYRLTGLLPKNELFGLVSQMRRAAASVPSNVAEGAGRGSDADHRRFLYAARGSVNELWTQVSICHRLKYLATTDTATTDTATAEQLMTRVRQLLSGTIRLLA
jgi:four helix bundle protein